MTLRLAGSSSGFVEIDSPAVGGNNTLVLPTGNGNAGNVLSTNGSGALSWVDRMTAAGPAFSAKATSSQSISSGTWTKIAFQSEEYDTANCFDNATNYRFTPNIAGYYSTCVFFHVASLSSYSNAFVNGSIFKNGSLHRVIATQPTNGNYSGIMLSAMVYLNGSSDYIEAYALSGYNFSVVFDGSYSATFQAALIRPA